MVTGLLVTGYLAIGGALAIWIHDDGHAWWEKWLTLVAWPLQVIFAVVLLVDDFLSRR